MKLSVRNLLVSGSLIILVGILLLYRSNSIFVSAVGDLWTQSGNDIFYTSGKVGVGTSSPLALLHVAGDSGIGSAVDPVFKSRVYDGDGEFTKLNNPYELAVVGNYAYVASYSDHSLTIIDISNPTDPVKESEVYDGDGEFSRLSYANSIAVSGNYAYITAESGMTIVDISDPNDPVKVSEVYDGDGEFDKLLNAEGIAISGNYAYVASPSESAMTIIDISNPSNPNYVTFIQDGVDGYSRLNKVTSVRVFGNYAYLTSSKDDGNDDGFTIVDISNPSSPVRKSQVYDGDGEFSRLGTASNSFVVGNYAYVISGGGRDSALTIMDITDPTDPIKKSEIYDGNGTFSKLEAATDIQVVGDYAFITSQIDNALTIINVSNPTSPALVGEYYNGDGEFTTLNWPRSIALSGEYAYIVGSGGLNILEVAGGIGDVAILTASSESTKSAVGIGTSQPKATLDVRGYMRLSKQSVAPVSCSSDYDGSIALTNNYRACVCKASSGWVYLSDGSTACSW